MDKSLNLKKLRNFPELALVVIGVISLGFIVITDRYFFKFFEVFFPSLSILADLRLTSLFIITIVYFYLKNFYSLKYKPTTEQRNSALILCGCWLMATAYFVLIQKVWVPTLKDWIDAVAFMITGLIVEEILFRGIVFDLSKKVFGDKKFGSFSIAVIISALLFGIQHLSYHHFAINSASITQLLYTMAMGLVFAQLRETTGTLWSVIVFHMINNSMTLLRNFS